MDEIERAIESCTARLNIYQNKFKNGCSELSVPKLKKQAEIEKIKISARREKQGREGNKSLTCEGCIRDNPNEPWDEACEDCIRERREKYDLYLRKPEEDSK